MKWGVRKDRKDRKAARQKKKIERRKKKSQLTPAQRQKRRQRKALGISLTLYGLSVGMNLLAQNGDLAYSSLMKATANKQASNRAAAGAKRAATMMADKGLTNYKTIVQTFDPVTGLRR